mgnify:CR=1 FL=1
MHGVEHVEQRQVAVERQAVPGRRADFGEGYVAGLADAVEAPLASLWGMKLHETRKVLTLTSHFLSWVGWIINERVWARIPNDLKGMVQEEAIAAGVPKGEIAVFYRANSLSRGFEQALFERGAGYASQTRKTLDLLSRSLGSASAINIPRLPETADEVQVAAGADPGQVRQPA